MLGPWIDYKSVEATMLWDLQKLSLFGRFNGDGRKRSRYNKVPPTWEYRNVIWDGFASLLDTFLLLDLMPIEEVDSMTEKEIAEINARKRKGR